MISSRGDWAAIKRQNANEARNGGCSGLADLNDLGIVWGNAIALGGLGSGATIRWKRKSLISLRQNETLASALFVPSNRAVTGRGLGSRAFALHKKRQRRSVALVL
jgi:hypothetical protein